VGRDGPCTPYQVRKLFLESPTPSWSGSSGTIYPLMRRLESSAIVTTRDAALDSRGTRLYRLTPAGRRALKSWMRPPLPPSAIGPGIDPIRTRLLFLEILAPAEREEFLEVVTRQLEGHIAELRRNEREAEATGDRNLFLAARGVLYVARARQRWFREVLEESRAGPAGHRSRSSAIR
jgi:DNA-binding PadR family transcriptional regulator